MCFLCRFFVKCCIIVELIDILFILVIWWIFFFIFFGKCNWKLEFFFLVYKVFILIFINYVIVI